MTIGVALIRGINVGGKNRLPMASLRELCGAVGFRDAATYIQSGNVVFRCGKTALTSAAERLAGEIETRHGFRPGVTVRSLEQLRAAVRQNPFAGLKEMDASKMLILFTSAKPPASAAAAIAALEPDPEMVRMVGREVYLYYPLGVGASKFPFSMVEKAVRVAGTTRNLNTVTTLVEMAEALEADRPGK